MTSEDIAVAIRDALDLLEHVETDDGETSIDVIDDFSNLFITTETRIHSS